MPLLALFPTVATITRNISGSGALLDVLLQTNTLKRGLSDSDALIAEHYCPDARLKQKQCTLVTSVLKAHKFASSATEPWNLVLGWF